jgi:hypothetical protein
MFLFYIVAILIVGYFLFSSRKHPIKKLVQQAAKWATMAQQDESPIIAMLHANYAVGYLWALKDIARPGDISREAGIDPQQFEEHIINMQSGVTKKVLKQCPEMAGEIDLYLSSIAGV